LKVTIDEIRKLRKSLDENRIEHEALVTQARILREHCQEIRQQCRQATISMYSMVQQPDTKIGSNVA
jgi:hypothetical protein